MDIKNERLRCTFRQSLVRYLPLLLCSLCYFGISYCLELPNAFYSGFQRHLKLDESGHLSFTRMLNILYCLPNILLPFVLNAFLQWFKKGLKFLFLFGIGNAFFGHLLFLTGLSFGKRWPIWCGYVLFGIGSECVTLCCLSYTNAKYLGTPNETLCISITTFACEIANFACYWVCSVFAEKVGFLYVCWFSIILCTISVICIVGILAFFPVHRNYETEVENGKVADDECLQRSPFSLLKSGPYWLVCFAYLLENQTTYSGSMKWHEILENRFIFSHRTSQKTISGSSLAGALVGPFTGFVLDRLSVRFRHTTKLHLSCMFITGQILAAVLVVFYLLDQTSASFWPIPCLVLLNIANAFFTSSFWSFVANFLQSYDGYFGYSFLSALLNLFCILSTELCTAIVILDPKCTILILYMISSLVLGASLLIFLRKIFRNK